MQKDLEKRLFVVLILGVGWVAAHFLSWPFVDSNQLALYGEEDRFAFSIMTYDIIPFFVAYALLEILALAVPILRSLRESGKAGRVRLRYLAVCLCVLFALPLGWNARSFVLGCVSLNPDLILFTSSHLVLITALLTIAVVCLMLIWSAGINQRAGVGNGFSMMLLVLMGFQLWQELALDIRAMTSTATRQWVMAMALLCLVIVLVVLVETLKPGLGKTNHGTRFPIRWTPAGILPLFGVLSGFYTIEGFKGGPFLPPVPRLILIGCIIFVVSCFFAFLFFRPTKLFHLTPGSDRGDIKRTILKGCLVGTVYLTVLETSPDWISALSGYYLSFTPSTVLLVTVIGIDMFKEVRMRQRFSLQPVYRFNDVAHVEVMRRDLDQHEVPYLIQGFHHRCLGYFLMPYVEMVLMVPEEQVEAAGVLIQERFGNADDQWMYPV